MSPAVELPVSCNLDCGAGCALLAEVRQGRLARIRDNPLRPPLARGCARGYAMARRVYAPDRITRPLLADGPRGSGRFRQAGWEEALDRVALGLAEIGEKHGPESVILLGGSGSCRGALHNTEALGPRFLSLFGGFTATSGSFSSAAERFVAPFVFGTPYTGLDPATLEHSRLILLWGANVADLRFGASLESWIRRCRRRGAPVVAVSVRRGSDRQPAPTRAAGRAVRLTRSAGPRATAGSVRPRPASRGACDTPRDRPSRSAPRAPWPPHSRRAPPRPCTA